MAYARDKDRLSRGVGAIASVDNVSPRAHAHRLAIARATQARDRAMVALSGDHRASGTASTSPSKGSGASKRTATVDHRTGNKAPAPGAPPAAAAPGTYGPAATFTDGPPPTKTPYPGMPRRSVTVEPPVGTPTPVKPTPAPTATPTPAPTSITVSGGSGGSGGSSSTPSPKPTSTSPGTPTPTTLPDIPEPDASGGGVSTRTWLLAGGGAALAAYFLFFRKATP